MKTCLHSQFEPRGRKRRGFRAAFTLVELLLVVSVVAALLVSISSALILIVKSYSGEYELEALERQSQRGAMELEYFAGRAISFQMVGSDGIILNQPPYLSTLYNRGELTSVTFIFEEEESRSTETERVGSLNIMLNIAGYESAKSYRLAPDIRLAVGSPIFGISEEGAFFYRWYVASLGSRLELTGLVPWK